MPGCGPGGRGFESLRSPSEPTAGPVSVGAGPFVSCEIGLAALSPAFSFSLLLATLYGALVHVIFGGAGRRLFTDIMMSCAGFAMGQAVSGIFGIAIGSIGPVHIVGATIGALAGIVLGRLPTFRQ